MNRQFLYPSLLFAWLPRKREHRRSGDHPAVARCQACQVQVDVMIHLDPLCRVYCTREEETWRMIEVGAASLKQLGCPHGHKKFREMQS